jgi:putative ABC transport system permease protein
VLIALIGIVNTLLLSVFERTHEIGLLRAVGMKRRQIRAMIRSEAVILALFGAVIGIVVGTGLGAALSHSLEKSQEITVVSIPFASLVLFVVIAASSGWPRRVGRHGGRPSSTCWRPSPPTDPRGAVHRP